MRFLKGFFFERRMDITVKKKLFNKKLIFQTLQCSQLGVEPGLRY